MEYLGIFYIRIKVHFCVYCLALSCLPYSENLNISIYTLQVIIQNSWVKLWLTWKWLAKGGRALYSLKQNFENAQVASETVTDDNNKRKTYSKMTNMTLFPAYQPVDDEAKKYSNMVNFLLWYLMNKKHIEKNFKIFKLLRSAQAKVS